MSHKLVSLYIGDGEYYARTDADNVIAELKRQIEFLKVTANSCKNCAQCADGMCKVFDKEFNPLKDKLRIQKYKRCLAMAKWCKLEQERIELIENQDITDDDFDKLVKGFYTKWHSRWLELADKFKTNLTINRKGGTNALQR